MFKTWASVALLATTALTSPSHAAMRFEASPFSPGKFMLKMVGEISLGDTVAAAKFVNQHITAVPGDQLIGYDLESPGGSVEEAELMARAIKKANMPTVVVDQCVSACFLPFSAGSTKYAITTAKIGVHSTSDADGKETAASAGVTTMLARDYAGYGVPPAIIGKMVATPPGEIVWLTNDDLRSMKVNLVTPKAAEEVPDLTGKSAVAPAPAAAPAPTLTPPAAAPPAAPTPDSAAFKTGLADGRAYRAWAENLVGAYRAGSDYWASVRSTDKAKLGCTEVGVTPAFTAGCQEAARRLAVFDHNRLSDPEYREGWNAAFQPS
jgi:hypothetical protein